MVQQLDHMPDDKRAEHGAEPWQVDVDGFALPLKELSGADPTYKLDLAEKGLGVASAIVIASLITNNSLLTSVWTPAQNPFDACHILPT